MVKASDVEAQLQRILASPTFLGSPRSAQFLSFCVFRGSAGEVIDLKETTIAVEVFNRPPDYDPKSDPIVRVHARRVREKLEHYYQTVGNDDPIRIDLPKGGYVPRFSRTLPNRKTDFSDWSAHEIGQAESPENKPLAEVVAHGRSRVVLGLIALCGLLMIVIVGLVRAVSQHSRLALEPVGTPLPVNLGNQVSDPEWSPDGVHLAFASTDSAGNSRVYIKSFRNSDPPKRITLENAAEMKPSWSPDGQRIAFLRLVDLSSFEILSLRFADNTMRSYGRFQVGAYVTREHGALDWSVDGKYLLTTEQISPSSPLRLVLVSSETGERTALTAPPTGSSGDIDGKFSPDGKWVAFRRGGLGDLYIVSSRGEQYGPASQLTQGMRGVRGISWSPDSRWILFGTQDNSVDRMGIWQIARTGGTPHLLTPAELDAVNPAVSKNGNFVFTARNLSTGLRLHSLSSVGPDRGLFPANAIDEAPALSPDGKFVAFASNRSGAEQLWVGMTSDVSPRQATHFITQGHIFFPAWSPDNRLVAFSFRYGAATNIYMYDLVSGAMRQITSTHNRDISPVFSADGTYLYYSSNDDGTSRLWRVRTDGAERAEPMFWEATTGYAPSSDGKWMYFVDGGATLTLVRRNIQDGASEIVFRTAGSPSFANDLLVAGGYVYLAVSKSDATRAELLKINPSAGTSDVVAHLSGIPPAEISGFSISADGSLLVTSQMTRSESNLYAQTLK
jgi:Tol biopolymer transport system component